ncbi:hypothetical protein LJC42_06275, partial [Eubacteriales bacterium OttesenSCG-928-K08]|nr:hypothetical protein [Eubacteriales bacterium OttesenSCG-928-K08]
QNIRKLVLPLASVAAVALLMLITRPFSTLLSGAGMSAKNNASQQAAPQAAAPELAMDSSPMNNELGIATADEPEAEDRAFTGEADSGESADSMMPNASSAIVAGVLTDEEYDKALDAVKGKVSRKATKNADSFWITLEYGSTYTYQPEEGESTTTEFEAVVIVTDASDMMEWKQYLVSYETFELIGTVVE